MQRENRYTILKNKDVCAFLTGEQQQQLEQLLYAINAGRARRGKDILTAVVVEHDWPEYETVWKMIEKRIDATPIVWPDAC